MLLLWQNVTTSLTTKYNRNLIYLYNEWNNELNKFRSILAKFIPGNLRKLQTVNENHKVGTAKRLFHKYTKFVFILFCNRLFVQTTVKTIYIFILFYVVYTIFKPNHNIKKMRNAVFEEEESKSSHFM